MVRVVPLYLSAMALVLKLCAWGVTLSLVVGFLCALARHFRVPVAREAAGLYIEISRNTPLMIQLFFLYFGLPKVGVNLSAFSCGVLGLAFLGGSYMAEAFRSGLESVSRGQREAAMSIGLSRGGMLRFVVLPQALSVAVPALCANVLFLLKETSVMSIIALADITSVAKDLIGMYYKTNEALVMLVAGYLLLLLPVSAAARLVERRLRFGTFGA